MIGQFSLHRAIELCRRKMRMAQIRHLTFVWGNLHFFLSCLNFQTVPQLNTWERLFGLDSARRVSLPFTCCLSAYPVNTFLLCINLDLPQDEVMSFGVE